MKDRICVVIQNLLISRVIPTKELKKWDLHTFSRICGDIMPTLRAKPASVFTFMSTVWAKHAPSSEQDGGSTTTQDAFPDRSIQPLATLFGFRIRSGLLECGVSFWNSECVCGIRSVVLEFGVSFWNSECSLEFGVHLWATVPVHFYSYFPFYLF